MSDYLWPLAIVAALGLLCLRVRFTSSTSVEDQPTIEDPAELSASEEQTQHTKPTADDVATKDT